MNLFIVICRYSSKTMFLFRVCQDLRDQQVSQDQRGLLWVWTQQHKLLLSGIYWIFMVVWISQGPAGKDGLPGHPGQRGETVRRWSISSSKVHKLDFLMDLLFNLGTFRAFKARPALLVLQVWLDLRWDAATKLFQLNLHWWHLYRYIFFIKKIGLHYLGKSVLLQLLMHKNSGCKLISQSSLVLQK